MLMVPQTAVMKVLTRVYSWVHKLEYLTVEISAVRTAQMTVVSTEFP